MFQRRLTVLWILSALSPAVWAEEAQETVQLNTVQVSGQRSYNALATEKNTDYTSFAVTVGTKIPASMREIPQSISLITAQQVKDRNVDTLDQLARKTPGLRVLPNDDGRSSIYARGYEYDEYNVDGLPAQMQSINGTLPNLIAFDRVEILRGPSGLFNSSGEMGGVVNLVRKRPTKDFQGSIGAGVGTQQQYKLDADVSGSLNQDGSVRGRVVAQTSGHSPKPAKQNNHHETFYAALDWDLNSATTLGLGYLYQQRKITPDNGLPTYVKGKNFDSLLTLPQNVFVGAEWNRFHMNSSDFYADLKHYFDNGGYGKIGLRYSDRSADSNYAFGGSGITHAANPKIAVTGLSQNIQQKAFALDASYSDTFKLGETTNDWVVGMDYNRFSTQNTQGRASLGTYDYRSFHDIAYVDVLNNARAGKKGYKLSESDNTLSEFGVYGKAVFRPVENLSLIVGGRVGHFKLDSDANTQSKTKYTGYTGVVWDLGDTDSLYASYSKLYKPQTETDNTGKILKPREGTQVEIGWKGSYFDSKLNTRVSLYRMQDKNAAAPTVDGNSAALGKRVMQGWEAEISGALTPKWQIHAGYSYLNSQIKQASTIQADGIFLLMPKHSANLWTTYDVTEKLTLGAGMNTMSGIASVQGVQAGGWTTFDAMAAYRFTPKLKAQLNIDNLFDRAYYARVGSVNTFNIAGPRRSVTANIRYSF